MQGLAQLPHASDSVLVALRAQLELTRSFQADLLSTVYWSLGVVLVIVVLLVGFGWFANFRVYQRDLEGLKRELETFVAKAIAEVTTRLQTDLTSALTTGKKDLENASSAKIDALSRDLLGRIGNLSRDLLVMKCDSLRAEFKQQVLAKTYGSAATSALRLLRDALTFDWDFYKDLYTNASLTGLIESLGKGGVLTASELKDATELLMRLPDSYAVLRDRAKEAV